MSNKQKTFVVYKHTSPSGKSYIGITYNYDKRCKQHQYKSNGCRLFSRAIKKYGWTYFSHEILKENLTLHEANYFEEILIKEHNTISPNGYNLNSGGRNALHSKESKIIMSNIKKGDKHPQFNKFGYDNKSSKKYLIIFPDGSVQIVTGLHNFCRDKYLSDSCLNQVAKGKLTHHSGHYCEFYNENKYSEEEINKKAKDWADWWSKNGPFKRGKYSKTSKKYIITTPIGDRFVISGLKHFCKENGLNQGNMTSVSSGRVKHHKGYKCENFIEDNVNLKFAS